MKEIKIPNAEIQELLSGSKFEFPKYSTQLINLANQNAQGTRPKIVGQMSDLIQAFDGKTLAEWEKWYVEKHPNAINNATEKIYAMIKLLKESLDKIDETIIRAWLEELVIIKTFTGLKFQEAILKKLAIILQTNYRLAKPEEESKGIDGFIGNTPISVKPETYKAKLTLNENIQVSIVYYSKNKDNIAIKYEPNDFK